MLFVSTSDRMSDHYYVGDTPSLPPLPPRLHKARNSSTVDNVTEEYDDMQMSPTKRWSVPGIKRIGHAVKPLVPKGLLKTSSCDASPPPVPSRESIRPPLPLPPHVSESPPLVGHRLPPPLPLTNKPDTKNERTKFPIILPNDEDDADEYEDVTFNAEDTFTPSAGDGMPFLKFVTEYQDRFPVAFEVVLGFSAHSEEVSISEGERFIAHFLKRSKVFTVEDENNEQHTIPYNTSFQFAPLYNPNNNKKEALSGFVFKTAGDIMISRILPKVVRTKRAFRGVSPESCITVNELLFVKEVIHKEEGRRSLKCVQFTTGKEKYLHEDCFGEFSTAPHDIRVYLPELLDHFQLPLLALMCMGPDNEEDIPSHLVSTVVTISTPRTEESLIASTIAEESESGITVSNDTESIVLNDIPLNFDINVNCVVVTPASAENMLKLTEKIYNTFNPSRVHPYLANYSRSQLALVKSFQKDRSMAGINLVENKILSKIRSQQENQEISGNDAIAGIAKRLQVLETQNEIFKRALEQMLGKSLDLTMNVPSVYNLQSECDSMKQDLHEIKAKLSTMHKHSEGKCAYKVYTHTWIILS